jgi:hypothetical protein
MDIKVRLCNLVLKRHAYTVACLALAFAESVITFDNKDLYRKKINY